MNIVTASLATEPGSPDPQAPRDESLKVRLSIPQGNGMPDTVAFLTMQQAKAVANMIDVCVKANEAKP